MGGLMLFWREGNTQLSFLFLLHGFRLALGKYVCNRETLHIYYK